MTTGKAEMVERVARLMYRQAEMRDSNVDGWRIYEKTARTMIAAMREPTTPMIVAACTKAEEEQARPVAIHRTDAEDCWRAMIDAALR